MRLVVGGLPFSVAPDAGLYAEELAIPGRLGIGQIPPRGSLDQPFHLELADTPISNHAPPEPTGRPARVRAENDRVHISHADFEAWVDPAARYGSLYRRVEADHPLEITLRVALCSLLPLTGGLPLHAAGVVAGDHGLVFFGPSGAGKSTLAQNSPFPVLSDELVVVREDPLTVSASGFWGEHEGSRQRPPSGALRAVFELGRGPQPTVRHMDRATAVRRLLAVVLVPPLPCLWQRAIGHVARLVDSMPVLRLEWTPRMQPWAAIADALDTPLAPGANHCAPAARAMTDDQPRAAGGGR